MVKFQATKFKLQHNCNPGLEAHAVLGIPTVQYNLLLHVKCITHVQDKNMRTTNKFCII